MWLLILTNVLIATVFNRECARSMLYMLEAFVIILETFESGP